MRPNESVAGNMDSLPSAFSNKEEGMQNQPELL